MRILAIHTTSLRGPWNIEGINRADVAGFMGGDGSVIGSEQDFMIELEAFRSTGRRL
jgi:hypothetical protein